MKAIRINIKPCAVLGTLKNCGTSQTKERMTKDMFRDFKLQFMNFMFEKSRWLFTFFKYIEKGTGGVLQEKISEKFREIHMKTPLPESLFK